MKGIIQITGEPASGKTSFAIGIPGIKPKDIGVYNFDVKPYPDLDFGFYRSYLHILNDTNVSKPEHRLVEQVLQDFEHAKGKKVLVFDAWEIFAKSWTSYFLERADEYKQTIGGGKFKRMSQLGHAPKVEVSLLDELMTQFGVETVLVINHLMDEYDSPTGSDEGVKTGRRVPESSKRLEQKATARFWLKHNQHHSCPIAVVLKDPGKHVWSEKDGIVPYKLFPDRLSPEALGDMSGKNVTLWQIINHYQQNPVGARLLEKYEQATPEEFAMVSGTLTDTQREVWERNQKLALLQGSVGDSLIDKIKEMGSKGKGFVEIFTNLKDDYPSLTLPQVKDTLGL